MATRTILSPGVEIRETDLSLIAPQNVGTNVFIAGYANQGPTDEVINITTLSDLDQIYGTPTNSVERYFYHGIKELLVSPARIYTTRLPYGADAGAGFGSQHSALVYPVKFVENSNVDPLSVVSPSLSTKAINALSAAITTDLQRNNGTYVLGEPIHFTLSEEQYNLIQEGSLFNWGLSALERSEMTHIGALSGAGMIILNKSKTVITSQFEGYYLGVADNTNIDPASNYDSIVGAKTVSTSQSVVSDFTTIPNGVLQFSLSSTQFGSSGSISQIMENLTDYNIDGREDDDILNIGVFKLRKSLYATDAYKLDYILDSGIVGSLDYYRTKPNQLGGPFVSFFLENEDSKNRNIEVLINPNISNKYGTTTYGVDGLPTKKIRVLSRTLYNAVNTLETTDVTSLTASNKYGVHYPQLSYLVDSLGYADNIYPVGAYSPTLVTSKELGDIPTKVERALELVKNDEIYDIDVVVEAGLGTVYAVSKAANKTYYDDSEYSTELAAKIDALRTSGELNPTGQSIREDYITIFNKFENFSNLPSVTGGRGDCVFIADPIRHIMVTGKNTRVLSDRSRNFQTDIYWAMRHQFETENTSYAAVYANWALVYDAILRDKIWIPFSPVAAAAYARNDAAEFPWSAPAGYTRGLVGGNVLNIAITPNQKQRDELYKSNLNPVLFSPSQGLAIFGQKTLSRKPSAFDRINVRRCFLALERPTKKASIFFVFEPNTEFTRTRFVNTIKPIFEYAKRNQGIYDYLIVCDERNNTPEVIDSNEMRADIYIKPTRTAEFILVNFIATRTDANFQELIGG